MLSFNIVTIVMGMWDVLQEKRTKLTKPFLHCNTWCWNTTVLDKFISLWEKNRLPRLNHYFLFLKNSLERFWMVKWTIDICKFYEIITLIFCTMFSFLPLFHNTFNVNFMSKHVVKVWPEIARSPKIFHWLPHCILVLMTQVI